MPQLFWYDETEGEHVPVSAEKPLPNMLYDQYGNQLGLTTAPLSIRGGDAVIVERVLGSLNDAITLNTLGMSAVAVEVDSGLTGTFICEGTIANNIWFTLNIGLYNGGSFSSTFSSFPRRGRVQGLPLAAVRIRVLTYTSGTALVRLLGSYTANPVAALEELPSQSTSADATSNVTATPFLAYEHVFVGNTGGTSVWERTRKASAIAAAAGIPSKIVAAVAITATTGATIWTPASGKKFRLMGFDFSSSAAASLLLYDGSAGALTNLIHRTPLLAAAGVTGYVDLGNGILGSAANFTLAMDVSTNSTVTGTVWGLEE